MKRYGTTPQEVTKRFIEFYGKRFYNCFFNVQPAVSVAATGYFKHEGSSTEQQDQKLDDRPGMQM